MSILVGAPAKAAPICRAGKNFTASVYNYRSFFAQVGVEQGAAYSEEVYSARSRAVALPKQLRYSDDAVYERAERLGSGSFGVVFRYVAAAGSPASLPAEFALKASHQDDDNLGVWILESRGITSFPWVPLELAHLPADTHYTLMPIFDGSLKDLMAANKLDDSEVVNLILKLLCIVGELADKGLAYMDLKAENLLYYACGTEGPRVPVSLFLGDIGSVVEARFKAPATTTYASPEQFSTEPRSLASMLWVCGVVLMQLLGADVDAFYFRTVDAMPAEGRRAVLKEAARTALYRAGKGHMWPAVEVLLGPDASKNQGSVEGVMAVLRRFEAKLDAAAEARPKPIRAMRNITVDRLGPPSFFRK
jgi:serine/threonine protein kinase